MTSTNIFAHSMDPQTCTREHLLACLARDLGRRRPIDQQRLLDRMADNGWSFELRRWLDTKANQYRIFLHESLAYEREQLNLSHQSARLSARIATQAERDALRSTLS